MREDLKKIMEFCVFVSIASLPFMITTNVLGIDTFLDSFENPNSYVYFKDSDSISGITTNQEKYVIIQKTSHPSFEVHEKDTILYFNFEGELECNKINGISGIGYSTKYYTNSEENEEDYVFDNQVVGKVIQVLDENIITDLSLIVWDISISNLNIESIM